MLAIGCGSTTEDGRHTDNRHALARIMVGLMISFALTPNWRRIGSRRGEEPPAAVINEAARVIVHGLLVPAGSDARTAPP